MNTKILVADDNVQFCTNVTDILELKGYVAVGVHDGLRALEAVKDDSFDLVILDIKMPVMDGISTLRRLKEVSPQTPVIMITAYAVEDLIGQALREGAFGAFQKPLDFDKLFGCIEKALPNGALIMVVDDDRDLCANLHDVLVEKGYRVRVANDGDTAMQMTRENKFDIIFLDLKLPDINGLDIYLAIRDIRPDVVTIIITGYFSEMENLVRHALERNAYAYLEKPLDIDHLFKLMEEALQ